MGTTAIIAGQGELPMLCADGVRSAGRRVLGLGMRGYHDPDFPGRCDEFRSVGFLRPGGWIRAARKAGCDDAILIGRVGKGVMHSRRFKLEMLREIPDLYTIDLWYRRLRLDRRSANLLRILADDLATRGLRLVDSTTYLKEHLATAGDMTARFPPPPNEATWSWMAAPLADQRPPHRPGDGGPAEGRRLRRGRGRNRPRSNAGEPASRGWTP